MIDAALILLRDELTNYLSTKDTASVVIDNIGMLETPAGNTLADNIVITLVNIEEESTLKNQSSLHRPSFSKAVYENAPVYLNLFVLITCNYSGNDYVLALKRLSYIISFVQSKNAFSTSSSVSGSGLSLDDQDTLKLKFTLELHTLTFEQINFLWGSLGGRQIPFAMYKLRLIGITEHAQVREVPLIEEVDTYINKSTSN